MSSYHFNNLDKEDAMRNGEKVFHPVLSDFYRIFAAFECRLRRIQLENEDRKKMPKKRRVELDKRHLFATRTLNLYIDIDKKMGKRKKNRYICKKFADLIYVLEKYQETHLCDREEDILLIKRAIANAEELIKEHECPYLQLLAAFA